MLAEKRSQCCCHCGKEKEIHYEKQSVSDNNLSFLSSLPLWPDLHVRDSPTPSASCREVCLLEEQQDKNTPKFILLSEGGKRFGIEVCEKT